jgi:hypothetical protein
MLASNDHDRFESGPARRPHLNGEVVINKLKILDSILTLVLAMASAQLGWYTWSYAGGEFLVALRDAGVFYCPEYPSAKASW